MQTYIGSGAYCYADSAAMLLESAGESVEPRLIEVLSGVGLGAFWIAKSQLLFLSGWTSAPDVGLSRAFELLGFEVAEEVEADGDPMPMEALEIQLRQGPALLGPLDMGELSYRPGARGANGADHFVLALGMEDDVVLVHDPAGYPAMPLEPDALARAWRAELIDYRRGVYRRWHSPVRVEAPTQREIADAAVRFFQRAYGEARAVSDPGATVGAEAIERLAASIRGEELPEEALNHLQRFALPLGVRRALDFSWYLRDLNPQLAELKERQARHLGRAHVAAVQRRWGPLAAHLTCLAKLERRVEAALAEAA